MQRILAIARLTWKSAFRYRLFWVMAALLVAAVVGLPLILKDDGTAEGLTRILLTYALSAITVLLGIATLWLSCGTLARDIEDCQIQMVCAKPVARWQIWLGKLLGILALNAMLLALSGGAVYALLLWRTQRLPADQQAKLRSEIFVARAAARERPPDIAAQARQKALEWLGNWRANHPGENLDADDLKQVSAQIMAQVRSEVEEVPSMAQKPKIWQINLGSLPARVRSQPLRLRVKFMAGDPNSFSNPEATYHTAWRIGPPDSPPLRFWMNSSRPIRFRRLRSPRSSIRKASSPSSAWIWRTRPRCSSRWRMDLRSSTARAVLASISSAAWRSSSAGWSCFPPSAWRAPVFFPFRWRRFARWPFCWWAFPPAS